MNATLTTYADPIQLEAWLKRAPIGQRIRYAVGPTLDPKHPVKVLTWGWHESGAVNLIKKKDPATGEWQHLVERRASNDDEVQKKRLRMDDAFRESPVGRILVALSRAANLDRACPTNAALAQQANLRCADSAAYAIRLLKEAGKIAVNRNSSAIGAPRVVTIIATGKRTAEG